MTCVAKIHKNVLFMQSILKKNDILIKYYSISLKNALHEKRIFVAKLNLPAQIPLECVSF